MQIATCGECWCFNRDGWCTLIDERCDANDEACGRAMPIVEGAEREGENEYRRIRAARPEDK